MLDCGLELPETLEAAAQRFGEFLSIGSWPSGICWIGQDDLLVGSPKYRFLVHPRRDAALQEAEEAYRIGLARGLGIRLKAMCATDTEAFSYVEVPEGELDRQSKLVRAGSLKLSRPTERRETSVVISDCRWKILAARYSERSKLLWS